MPILLSTVLLLLSDLYPPAQHLNPFPQLKNTVTTSIDVPHTTWNNDTSWIVEYAHSEYSAVWLNIQRQKIGEVIDKESLYRLGDFERWSFGGGYIQEMWKRSYVGAYLYYDQSDHENCVLQEPGKASHYYRNHTVSMGVEFGMHPYRLVINGYLPVSNKENDIPEIYGALHPKGSIDVKLTATWKAITGGVGGYIERFAITGAQSDVYAPQPLTVKGGFAEATMHYKSYGIKGRCCYDNVHKWQFHIMGHWMKGAKEARHQPIERYVVRHQLSHMGSWAAEHAQNHYKKIAEPAGAFPFAIREPIEEPAGEELQHYLSHFFANFGVKRRIKVSPMYREIFDQLITLEPIVPMSFHPNKNSIGLILGCTHNLEKKLKNLSCLPVKKCWDNFSKEMDFRDQVVLRSLTHGVLLFDAMDKTQSAEEFLNAGREVLQQVAKSELNNQLSSHSRVSSIQKLIKYFAEREGSNYFGEKYQIFASDPFTESRQCFFNDQAGYIAQYSAWLKRLQDIAKKGYPTYITSIKKEQAEGSQPSQSLDQLIEGVQQIYGELRESITKDMGVRLLALSCIDLSEETYRDLYTQSQQSPEVFEKKVYDIFLSSFNDSYQDGKCTRSINSQRFQHYFRYEMPDLKIWLKDYTVDTIKELVKDQNSSRPVIDVPKDEEIRKILFLNQYGEHGCFQVIRETR